MGTIAITLPSPSPYHRRHPNIAVTSSSSSSSSSSSILTTIHPFIGTMQCFYRAYAFPAPWLLLVSTYRIVLPGRECGGRFTGTRIHMLELPRSRPARSRCGEDAVACDAVLPRHTFGYHGMPIPVRRNILCVFPFCVSFSFFFFLFLFRFVILGGGLETSRQNPTSLEAAGGGTSTARLPTSLPMPLYNCTLTCAIRMTAL